MPRSVRRSPRPLLVALAVLLPVLSLVGNAAVRAWQTAPVSPATGHASVIAHGLAELAGQPLTWRVTYRSSQPDDEPVAVPDDPLFLLGESGTVLVDRPAAGTALLLPDTAMLSIVGTMVDVPTIEGNRGAWFEIALAEDAESAAPADSVAVFSGAPFAAPVGERPLMLVRDVLAEDETTTVIGQESPVLLLVTGGTLRVEATDGSSATLRVGEAATFGGDLVVTGESAAPASFAAALVGADVSPATPPATPVAVAASPVAEPPSAGVGGPGVISISVYGCPTEVRPRQVSPETCEEAAASAELELVALGDDAPRPLGRPATDGEATAWSGLPLGRYAIRAVEFGTSFDRVLVPDARPLRGDAAVGGDSTDAYEIVLDESAPIATVEVYALPRREPPTATRATPTPATRTAVPRSAATPTPDKTSAVAVPRRGSISLRVWSCPDSLATFSPARCVPASRPYDVVVSGEAGGASLRLDNARAEGEALVWEDVAFGAYLVRQPLLSPGAATYFLPEGALLADNSGYRVSLDAATPTLALDLYNLAPAGLPVVSAAPTVPVPPAAPTLPLPTPIPSAAPASVANAAGAPTPAPALAPAAVAAVPVDTDGDSLTDDVETGVWGTDPTAFDTDGDGTGDGAEALAGGDPTVGAVSAAVPTATSPSVGGSVDSDGDGVFDADEGVLGTGAGNPDSDGDGWLDGNEVDLGTNPLDPASLPQSP